MQKVCLFFLALFSIYIIQKSSLPSFVLAQLIFLFLPSLILFHFSFRRWQLKEKSTLASSPQASSISEKVYSYTFLPSNKIDQQGKILFPLLVFFILWGVSLFIFFLEGKAISFIPPEMNHFFQEEWLRESFSQTKLLEVSNNLLLQILFLALLPALSEELLFRILLIHYLRKFPQSISFSLWGGAIIFSLLHFSFFAFLPRVLLGYSFAYCFYHTKKWYIPFLLHFFVNLSAILLP